MRFGYGSAPRISISGCPTTYVVAIVCVALFTGRAYGQSVDPFYEWIQSFLAGEYNIEADGVTFVLGDNPATVLSGVNAYGGDLQQEVLPTDGEDVGSVGWTQYFRYRRGTTGANQWTGGILFPNRAGWTAGDVGLLVAFYRGQISGGPPTLPLQYEIFERPGVVWEAPFGQRQLQVTSDWSVVLIPFEVGQTIPVQNSHLAFWTGDHAITLDMPAPVMLNFGNRYTRAVLQNLIDTGGQVSLAANFSASVRRGVPPFEVQFDASTSTPAAEISSYSWDFGDASIGTGVTATHTYTQQGRFTVRLTVTNASGQSASFTREVVSFDGIGLPETPLEIPFAGATPTIDGSIEASWNGAVSVSANFHVGGDGPPDDASDLSATVRAMWDEENLYVLYEVTDETKLNDSPDSYHDDSVDLYLDGRNEKTTGYDQNDAQYEFSWYPADSLGRQRVTGNAVANDRANGVDYSFSSTAEGYVIEASVPWSNVDAVVVPGSLVGLDFMVNDSDVPGPAQSSKAAWFSLQDNAWQRMDAIGTAVLVGGEDQVTSAQFAYSTPSGRYLSDMPILFDASSSFAPGTIVSYEWDFGDGETGQRVTVEHAYAVPGSYDVSLTITDDRGISRSRTRTVVVVDGTGLREKPLLIPLAQSEPALDGLMDESWSRAQVVTIGTRANNNPPQNDADLSAEARIMWDPDYLYVFFTVNDDVLRNDSESTWQDDSAEVYLDGQNEKAPQAYDENDGQFEFAWDADTLVTGCTSCLDPDAIHMGTEFKSLTTAGGYAIEARIPWASVGVSATEGHEIGLELMVNDDDNLGTDLDARDTKLQWFGQEGQDDPWQWAHVWGNARLVNTLPTGIEAAKSELPDVFSIESVYPNPFNPTTTAALQIRKPGEYQMRIYNVLGQLIWRRLVEARQAGRLEVNLDFGAYASGMYLISVEHTSTGKVATARAILVK